MPAWSLELLHYKGFFDFVFVFLIDLSSPFGAVMSTLILEGLEPGTDTYTSICYWKNREGCWSQLRLRKEELHKSDNYIANTITGSCTNKFLRPRQSPWKQGSAVAVISKFSSVNNQR